MQFGNLLDDWRSEREIVAAFVLGFGIHIAEGLDALFVVGLGEQQVAFDSRGMRGGRGIIVGQRAEDAGGGIADLRVGRILLRERAEQRRRLLEMRAPQVHLGELARGCGILLGGERLERGKFGVELATVR